MSKRIANTVGSTINQTYHKTVKSMCSPVHIAQVTCPTGLLKLVACSDGMHELTLSNPATHISSDVPCKPLHVDTTTLNKPLELCIEWLQAFFQGDKKILDACRPPLCSSIFNYDSFRAKVWCTLEKYVRFGETVSYGELARLSGSPRASQAVGSAMRNNPTSLIVPCHRVILASGASGNYAGGKMNDTKIWLLDHEKNSA